MLLDFASYPPSLENRILNDPCLRFEIFIVHLLLMICYCIFKMFIFKIYCRFLDVLKLRESIIEDCARELYFRGLMNSWFYTTGNFSPCPHPDSTCKCRWNVERQKSPAASDGHLSCLPWGPHFYFFYHCSLSLVPPSPMLSKNIPNYRAKSAWSPLT